MRWWLNWWRRYVLRYPIRLNDGPRHFRSLSDALSVMRPHDTLHVRRGTYQP